MQDRLVVITGATGGLGRVAARAFAGKGASLVLLSSNRAKLETLAAELALPAERVYLHDADLRNPAAVREAAQAVRRRFGAAHVLLHLVGGWTGGKTLADTDPDDARAMVEQHLWTTFHLMQQFGPLLAESG